jgi:8-oxo-dGTP pyrophosphatase MutT (NUDIX family)
MNGETNMSEHGFFQITQKAFIRKGNLLLIMKDKKSGEGDLPGGRMNQKEFFENWIDSLKRELQEETGILECHLLRESQFLETEPYSQNKVARYYLGEVTTQNVSLLPNPENGIIEHHEYRWLTYDKAQDLLNPRLKIILKWAHSQLVKK